MGVLAPGAHLPCGGWVHRSVLMDGVDVGRHAVVRNAILDKNVRVAPGVSVGVDKEDDRARGFAVSTDGVTVVGKGVKIDK